MRDESVGVDVFHEAEDVERLGLFCQYHYYLDILFAVPSLPVKQGDTAVYPGGDAFGYLFVLAREDEELHRLACAVDDIINHDAHDEEHAEAEEHAPPVVEDEIARRDDDDVAIHHHASQRHVLVFIDNPGDDVGAARASVVAEHDADTESKHAGSDDTCHEVLSRSEELGQVSGIVFQQPLEEPEQEGQHKDGIYGLYTELWSQYFQGKA